MYHQVTMSHMTIDAPDELLQQLRRIADEQRTSLANIIREALEERVRRHRPKPRSIGIGDSGRDDISRRIGEEEAMPEPWR